MQTKMQLDGRTVYAGNYREIKTGEILWFQGANYRVRHVSTFEENRETSQEVQIEPAM